MASPASPDQPRSRPRSVLRATSLHSPASHPPDRPRQLGFKKARKLSRVFTEISLLDALVGRKSVDGLGAGQASPRKPPPSAHTHKMSLGSLPQRRSSIQNLKFSLAGRLSRPTTPIRASSSATNTTTLPSIAIPDAKLSTQVDLQSLTQPSMPSTPQIRPHLLPEQIPLPLSRPGSAHGSYSNLLSKKRRKSLDLMQLDEFGVKTARLSRSQSLRMPSFSDLSRPTSPKSSTTPSVDIRDPPAPPETVHQHYIEVKRARKMTQLFGQELPPELIRILGDRRNVDTTRHRADSSVSLILDPIPATPTVEEESSGITDEENVAPPSPPKAQCTDFQERRKRVAKLTQFFGVNHAEIASSIMYAKSDDQGSTSLDDQASIPTSLAEPGQVGVKVVSGRRWGLGENMKDVEMSDAITKLRCLKAN